MSATNENNMSQTQHIMDTKGPFWQSEYKAEKCSVRYDHDRRDYMDKDERVSKEWHCIMHINRLKNGWKGIGALA